MPEGVRPVSSNRVLGRSLGGYRIVERVGRGGMATVYKAHDPVQDRYVAIKILPPMLAEDPQFSQRFRREARVVMQLEHPHIVPVEEMRDDGEYVYLVMPYLAPGNLADRLQLGPVTVKDVARLMRQTASALDYAHRQGVVHRDVKPSNILLDEAGNALLSDFGLARIQDASVSLTGSAVLGTPAYISPELAQGRKADARSDQYSLGIILFELVTGRLPFDDEIPMALLLKHINQPLPSPRSFNPGVPEPLENVILKATAKKPDDRFASVAEMWEALEKALGAARASWIIPPYQAPGFDEAGETLEPEAKQLDDRLEERRLLRAAAVVAGVVAVAAMLLAFPRVSGVIGAATSPSATASTGGSVRLLPSPAATATQAPATLSASPTEANEDAGPQATTEGVRRLILPPTPTPVASLEPDDPRSILDLSRPDAYDYFEDSSRWYDYESPGRAAYWFEDGLLIGKDFEPEERYSWWSYADRQSGNLYFEVTTAIGDCIEKDSVGLAFRVDPTSANGGYAFEVSCDGHWRFRRHPLGRDAGEIFPWSYAEAIQQGPGASNRIGIWAYQADFYLFVNGQKVAEIHEPKLAYSYGTFALYVRASRTYDLLASFDDFALWHIRFIP